MPRPPKGVYVVGDRVIRFGYRDRDPRSGEEFHAVTEPAARALLADGELPDLAWDGTAVVRRAQAEIDARMLQETKNADSAHFEREREKAVLLVLLDEINVLRQRAGFPLPLDIDEVKANYKAKLNR